MLIRAHFSTSDTYVSDTLKEANLRITNELAKRGVALMKQFNLKLTKDGQQRQYLFQVMDKHRQRFPDARKPVTSGSSDDHFNCATVHQQLLMSLWLFFWSTYLWGSYTSGNKLCDYRPTRLLVIFRNLILMTQDGVGGRCFIHLCLK